MLPQNAGMHYLILLTGVLLINAGVLQISYKQRYSPSFCLAHSFCFLPTSSFFLVFAYVSDYGLVSVFIYIYFISVYFYMYCYSSHTVYLIHPSFIQLLLLHFFYHVKCFCYYLFIICIHISIILNFRPNLILNWDDFFLINVIRFPAFF